MKTQVTREDYLKLKASYSLYYFYNDYYYYHYYCCYQYCNCNFY